MMNRAAEAALELAAPALAETDEEPDRARTLFDRTDTAKAAATKSRAAGKPWPFRRKAATARQPAAQVLNRSAAWHTVHTRLPILPASQPVLAQ
jgi:hypothetical protein